MPITNPFANIGFEDFCRWARDPACSKYQRIGFPDEYRQGREPAIFADIRGKLTLLDARGKQVLDVGPGSSDLPVLLIDHCAAHEHQLHLVDGAEMLAHLPDRAAVHKLAAQFPNCASFIRDHQQQFDVILCYSVLHYAFVEVPFFRFIDSLLALLAAGGQLLLGDIPNNSKRKRFFASAAGTRFHQQFMNTDAKPTVDFNCIEHDQLDDAVVVSLVQRARAAGFDAYVVPQHPSLPMANRREDILIVRP
ncbi:MAG TPA: class I SAM-dependent methyltransferase [Pirellulales bacterium]|jgi:2-polyprenyl-3-methyl-5-hydroxy-6-metoxy-1,4-benzoquinol methylase|nr:class I SAM-dependent methyltransferase [Pirellulales bacterium]